MVSGLDIEKSSDSQVSDAGRTTLVGLLTAHRCPMAVAAVAGTQASGFYTTPRDVTPGHVANIGTKSTTLLATYADFG